MNAPKKGRKAAPARDDQTGQFEAASPFTDPQLADQAVRIVRAVDDLAPVLALFAREGEGDGVQAIAAFSGAFLAVLRDVMLRELAADPEALREAKKTRLDAKRLGNMPLAEQQRLEGLARGWLQLPGTHERALPAAMQEALQVRGVLAAVNQNQVVKALTGRKS
jgi:hypothetical protein